MNKTVRNTGQRNNQLSTNRQMGTPQRSHFKPNTAPAKSQGGSFFKPAPAPRNLLQRTPVTIAGRQFMTGDVTLNPAAETDVTTNENLFSGADQKHIGVVNSKLAYEIGYKTPEDPFRWNILRSIVDNEHVEINGISPSVGFKVREVSLVDHKLIDKLVTRNLEELGGGGVTLPTYTKQLQVPLAYPTIVASTSPQNHQVYYESGPKGRTNVKGNPLAHEFFGHLWLVSQNSAFQHRKKVPEAAHIVDPLGRPYHGTVKKFIDSYAQADETAIFDSPTQQVSPAFLNAALLWIEQQGAEHIIPAVPDNKDKRGSFDKAMDQHWETVSANYEILITDTKPVKINESLSLDPSTVVHRLAAWAKQLPKEKERAFKNVLNTVGGLDSGRRKKLAHEVILIIP